MARSSFNLIDEIDDEIRRLESTENEAESNVALAASTGADPDRIGRLTDLSASTGLSEAEVDAATPMQLSDLKHMVERQKILAENDDINQYFKFLSRVIIPLSLAQAIATADRKFCGGQQGLSVLGLYQGGVLAHSYVGELTSDFG